MTFTSRPTDRSATRRGLRREVPSTAAILADAQDFTAMRRYRTFPFDDHDSYLRQMETLLRGLTAQGVVTTVGLFDPVAYEKYCARLTLDPDRPDSRSRYTAEAARTGTTLLYEGGPLTRLLPLLLEDADRRAHGDRAAALLARAGSCEECGDDLSRTAFTRATHAVRRLLTALGEGTHHLVCSLAAGEPPLLAVLRTTAGDGTGLQLAEHETLVFCTVLAAGFALRTPGGIVSRTTTGPDTPEGTDRATARDTVRGWSLRESWLRPLSAAEVFTAYCTDADTGEPIPPEHGVDYSSGFPLTPPPEPHDHR
ncbi:hypothetical protein [Streptomyces kronopolitis]|uniref:hypothetical protein n=1 Tax=Streptomyces kronopolitis TaxID=1612435 RepID=UPI003D967F5C